MPSWHTFFVESARLALHSSHSVKISIQAGWFIQGVQDNTKRTLSKTYTNLPQALTGKDEESVSYSFAFSLLYYLRRLSVHILSRAVPHKWNSQDKSITLWHYTPSNSTVYQLLKQTMLVNGGSRCKPQGEVLVFLLQCTAKWYAIFQAAAIISKLSLCHLDVKWCRVQGYTMFRALFEGKGVSV